METIKQMKAEIMLIRIAVIILISVFIFIYAKVIFLFYENNGKERFIFGATYMTMNNDFYEVLNNEILRDIENQGGKLITLDPALNQKKQNQQIQYLIDQKVDVIFLNPVDWKGVKDGLKAAKKADIPIIVVDAPVYHSELVSATIVSDNYQAGVLCAKDMMDKMDRANIVLLTHNEAKSGVDRIQGFLDTIKGFSQYSVIAQADTQGQIERSLPKMEQIIDKYDNIDVVMALNDPAAMGALAALDSKGYHKDVLVYGVDGSPDAKKLIQDCMMTGTAAQFPKKMGEQAVQTAYDLLDGKKVSSEITISVEMLNQNNIQKYDIGRWQ